jgi:serine/threonine-protein kinase
LICAVNADRRRRVEEVFEEVLERARDEWDEALAAACGEDAELREEVCRLLSAHERMDGLLDRPPPGISQTLRKDGQEGEEELVGRYRILREIGKGGMGRVYQAERADGHFKQRVALKIIPWADPALQARVVAERQILASLQHPHIGRLLDGGVTEDGRPFLVMEYVDGLPVDVYCDRMRLSIRERLKLFLTILGAVEHAHRNLVVHRDIKPSNILVTPSGEVKLLDFGIAKLLNPNLGPSTPVTLDGDRALTPEYASPEQVRGEAITTSADIYSLGVVLYQILSGYRPYNLSDRALPQLVKMVCEKDPLPPSERVARASRSSSLENGEDPSPPAVAEARHTTSHRLIRQLSGDLDAIVMKALRKEPSRRYGSLELFSQDIEHYLNGMPVEARKGNRWYRLKKGMRRHGAVVTALTLAVLSLLLGAGAAVWQANIAARQAALARETLRESEEVTDFLLGLFEASNPEETPGETVTALDLLRRGERRADALVGEPVIRARMLQVIAQAHRNLGRFSSAESLAGEAVTLLEGELGTDHQDVASALVLQSLTLGASGQYDAAIQVMERAMTIQEQVFGPADTVVGRTLEELSGLTVYSGDLARAEDQARRAWSIQETALGPEHPTTLNALSNLGSVYRYRGRLSDAEDTFRRVLEGRRLLENPEPGDIASSLLSLGDHIVNRGGNLDEAEALFREALDIARRAGADAPGSLVWALTSLGEVLELKSALDEAKRLFLEAVDSRRRTYGDLHHLVAEAMADYGAFLTRTGRPEEAEVVLQEAVDIQHNTVGLDHPRSSGNLTALGRALAAQRKLEEADSVVRQALETRRRALGYRTPVVAETMGILADIRTLQGDFAGAHALLEQALEIVKDQPSDGDVPKSLHAAFVRLYEAWGRPEDADRHRLPSTSRR